MKPLIVSGIHNTRSYVDYNIPKMYNNILIYNSIPPGLSAILEPLRVELVQTFAIGNLLCQGVGHLSVRERRCSSECL